MTDTEMKLLFVGAWLVIGWLFTIWYVNWFLDNRRFADGQEIGPGTMLMLNFVGPAMLAVMIVMVTIAVVIDNGGDVIRKFYGVRD